MFDGFFENNSPIKSEQADKERVDKIKAAVLSSIREEPAETDLNVCGESEVTPMKKRNIARSFIIAAAAASLGTMSLVSANAISDSALTGNISDTSSTFDERLTDGFSSPWRDFRHDEALKDGSSEEFCDIIAIDENGEEHLIASDNVVFGVIADGGFYGYYDIPDDETAEKFIVRDYNEEITPEEIMNGDISHAFFSIEDIRTATAIFAGEGEWNNTDETLLPDLGDNI